MRPVQVLTRAPLTLSREAGDIGRYVDLSDDERHGMSHGDDMMLSLRAVNEARSMLDSARTSPGVPKSAQRRLLDALEEYADALSSHGLPMPYRMCSELAIYRAMFNATRRPTR